MRAVVVGVGESARELIRRLGDSWSVVVVDTDAERFDEIAAIRDVDTVVGDGSSSVVLRQAGIEGAVAVIASTSSDDVNLEVSRLAKDAGVEQVIALARVPERMDEYRELGVEVISPARLAARGMEVAMEPRKVASTTFADGRAEAIEFEIAPDSPVQGKALKEIHSELWVVAAILRDGKLVVPHGNTRLLTGDKVTVVGSATDFTQVVRTFAGGVSRFPLNFGRKVVVPLGSETDRATAVEEAAYFVRNSNAVELLVIHRDPESIKNQAEADKLARLIGTIDAETLGVEIDVKPVGSDLLGASVSIASEESVGTIVIRLPERSAMRPFSKIPSILNRLADANVPVLLTRGVAKFTTIVAPARRTVSGDVAGRAAIDIAKRAGVSVTGVAVASPVFMGRDDLKDKRAATAWLRREAAVQDVEVERHVVRGNPVKVLSSVTRPDTLLVVSMPKIPVSRFNPGLAVWAAARGEGSVLFVPVSE
ncbi:MAG: NAD-binding protein [Actinomycetia bacterium]|nr:NAD-binding protein [Actinomycetes bacterium]